MRTVIATLQDLGFVIDKADHAIGTVTATRLERHALRMTVTVRAKGEERMLVRTNAQYRSRPVRDPEPYRDFFASLQKAMFLEAQEAG
jgi:hypothetical protein